MSIVPIDALVRRVRGALGDEPYEDYLFAAVTSVATTATVNEPTAWAEGDVAEVDDGSYEQFKVTTGDTNPMTIRRGHNDTDAVAHLIDSVLLKNPKFGGGVVLDVLTNVASSLWPRAWATRSTTITPSATETYYALPSDVMDVLAVTQKQTGTPVAFTHFGSAGSGLPFSLHRNLPVADYADGKALSLPYGPDNTTNSITVTYRSVLTAEDITDGLMADTIVLGACMRLAAERGLRFSWQISEQEAAPTSQAATSALVFATDFQAKARALASQMRHENPPARMYVR